jgi:hypothetical protein
MRQFSPSTLLKEGRFQLWPMTAHADARVAEKEFARDSAVGKCWRGMIRSSYANRAAGQPTRNRATVHSDEIADAHHFNAGDWRGGAAGVACRGGGSCDDEPEGKDEIVAELRSKSRLAAELAK